MIKHEIKISANGTKTEILDFLAKCSGLIQTSKMLENKDPDFGIINGSMYKGDCSFTIKTNV
jgi:hypothetical protein